MEFDAIFKRFDDGFENRVISDIERQDLAIMYEKVYNAKFPLKSYW